MSLSTPAVEALQRTTDAQGFLDLLTITGADIGTPVRLVNDTRNFVSQGYTFIAIPFELIPPKQGAKEIPRTQIRLDNVGREMVQVLEALPPGAELMAKVQTVYRAQPDVVQAEFSAPMSGLKANVFTISGVIGPSVLMTRPAVAIRFDPHSAPGLFQS